MVIAQAEEVPQGSWESVAAASLATYVGALWLLGLKAQVTSVSWYFLILDSCICTLRCSLYQQWPSLEYGRHHSSEWHVPLNPCHPGADLRIWYHCMKAISPIMGCLVHS